MALHDLNDLKACHQNLTQLNIQVIIVQIESQ